MATKIKLRIGLLQLNPIIKQVNQNIEHATQILHTNLNNRILDLLVLPELGLTGYSFKSKEDIVSCLEPTANGVSTNWAKKISKQLGCHTIVGYPERSIQGTIYNSAVMISPDGEVLFNYRKSFMYDIDKDWGCDKSPDGFQSFVMPSLHNLKVQVGICMDLNPEEFKAPFNSFEFSNSVVDNDVSLVIGCMAWTHSKSPNTFIQSEADKIRAKMLLEKTLLPNQPDLSTIQYWQTRMTPLILNPKRTTAMIISDRCGWEGNTLFAGTSSVLTFKERNTDYPANNVKCNACLGQLEEGLLYHEIEVET